MNGGKEGLLEEGRLEGLAGNRVVRVPFGAFWRAEFDRAMLYNILSTLFNIILRILFNIVIYILIKLYKITHFCLIVNIFLSIF